MKKEAVDLPAPSQRMVSMAQNAFKKAKLSAFLDELEEISKSGQQSQEPVVRID